jgi:hypothetical protein
MFHALYKKVAKAFARFKNLCIIAGSAVEYVAGVAVARSNHLDTPKRLWVMKADSSSRRSLKIKQPIGVGTG